MSDKMSVEEENDSDIDNEIQEIFERCRSLENHFHTSKQTIQKLNLLVENHKNIMVEYDGTTQDLDIVIERLHLDALENIKSNGVSNFGEKLLAALETAIFLNNKN
jgi:predicted RNase H-like nuclease (RuvC/YqgF family)